MSEKRDRPKEKVPDEARAWAEKMGERLKLAREQRGLGCNEVDRAIGQGSGYTSPLERGEKARPAVDVLLQIAKVLDVRPAWLFFDDGPMRDEPKLKRLEEARDTLEDWIEEVKKAARNAASDEERPGGPGSADESSPPRKKRARGRPGGGAPGR